MNRNLQISFSSFFCVLFVVSGVVFGQLPNARLQRVFPCGGKIGTTTELAISGVDLDEVDELVFSNPAIKAKAKRGPAANGSEGDVVPGQFVVEIPANVAPGIYEIRAKGRFGLSTSRRFAVSSRSELVTNDQNKSEETAMSLPIESAVSGRAVANGKHLYKFSLEKDEKVTVFCQCKTIDSKMNPVLVIMDLNGNEIARARSTSLHDAVLFFKAPISSQYLLSVRDAIYSGGADYFYRLGITKKPYLISCNPAIVAQGSTGKIELNGWNLPGGSDNGNWETVSANLNELVIESESGEGMPLRPAGFAIDWKPIAMKQGGQLISNQIPVLLSGQRVTVEDSKSEVTQIQVPTDVAGNFQPKNETDVYEFDGKKGESFQVDVYSHQMGFDTDLILTIQQKVTSGEGNVTWKNLVVNDDPASRKGITPDFSVATDDPSVAVTIPADGRYRVFLKDQFGTYDDDPRAGYAISIKRAQPDFHLVCHPAYSRVANANQILGGALTLRRGGRFHLKLQVIRENGFGGPVQVTCDGLPAGIEFDPVTVSPLQSSVDLIFYAKEDAPASHGFIKLSGKATVGEQEVVKPANYHCVTWDTGNKGQAPAFFRKSRQLEISVMPAETAAATVVAGNSKVLETSIGGKIKLPVKLTRRHGFSEPLKLVAMNLPGQLKPADLTIPKDKSEGTVEIFVKDKNTAAGEYQFFLKGDSKFKYSRNPEAAARADAKYNEIAAQIKNDTDAKNKLMADAESLKKQMADADQKLVKAQQLLDQEKSNNEMAVKQAAELEKAITASKTNTAKPVDPLILQAAETRLNQLKQELKSQTGLKKAEAEQKAALENKTMLANRMTDDQSKIMALDANVKALNEKLKAAKATADNLKKQSAPKDLFYMTVSNSVQLRVVSSPFQLTGPKVVAAQPGQTVKQMMGVNRKYGFTDTVSLTFKAPAGIDIKPAAIAKDKPEAEFAISIGNNVPVGMHSVQVNSNAKFNNVDVQSTMSFQIEVTAKTDSASESKEAKK